MSTTFTASQPIDFDALSFVPRDLVSATATQIQYYSAEFDALLNYYGSFSYDGLGNASGTITGYDDSRGGNPYYVHAGGSWDVETFASYMSANDPSGLLAYVFAGDDLLNGSAGDDRLSAFAGSDTLLGGSGNDLLQGGDGEDRLEGGDGGDRLLGGDGNDGLDGGVGRDILRGGLGDDVYAVDDRYDRVIEGAGGGADEVVSTTTSYTLPDFVENLTLTGSAQTGFGNALGNVIVGNGLRSDFVQGNGGADRVFGDGGSDVLYGGDGHDSIAGGLDNDYLAGEGGNDTLVGGSGIDNLFGGAGNDSLDSGVGGGALDGGTGRDTMTGGTGDDTYYVDVVGDRTIETTAGGAGGRDFVRAAVSWTLAENIEDLNLYSLVAGRIDGTGNGLDNRIVGDLHDNWVRGAAGDDTLSGGDAGDDTLVGGAGNDIYFVNVYNTTNGSSLIVEGPGGGVDGVVLYGNDFTLPSGVENLTLQSRGLVGNTGTGNVAANTITGGFRSDRLQGVGGDDVLEGGGGNDTLEGGAGNDTLRGEFGRDEIIGGFGDDVLMGEGSIDRLVGGAGNDTLNGGYQFDRLIGGTGQDVFVFDAVAELGNTVDAIFDFETSVDRLHLAIEMFTALSTGALPATAFHAGSAAADADDRIVYDQTTGFLAYDADGAEGQAATVFARLGAGTALVATDLWVV